MDPVAETFGKPLSLTFKFKCLKRARTREEEIWWMSHSSSENMLPVYLQNFLGGYFEWKRSWVLHNKGLRVSEL